MLSRRVRWLRGSIPACAGEPRACAWRLRRRSVYPRVCGGTGRCRHFRSDSPPLSPRVRGNPPGTVRNRTVIGSIPACAGEPARWQQPPRRAPVYPRVCGGTSIPQNGSQYVTGLSPRVRGNPIRLTRCASGKRSIPACAGEPHTTARAASNGGLSPRVRGNPLRKYHRSHRSEVYPRVCGGTSTTWATTATVRGLSPRVRGNPGTGLNGACRLRSIPACAGEPGKDSFTTKKRNLYPRVCGGTRRARLG